MKEKMIRCSVCGELKPEKSFPKNRLLDGTVKISGDVCYTCMSRKYRNKSKEETEKLKSAAETTSLTLLDMIAKLNSLGYVIIKKEDYENLLSNQKQEDDEKLIIDED
jgi:hypothetical protein